MILIILIIGFILRLVYTIYWVTIGTSRYDFDNCRKVAVVKPTKKEALKFYLIPFYWVILVKNYLFGKVFKD